jgi:hypothetical protein
MPYAQVDHPVAGRDAASCDAAAGRFVMPRLGGRMSNSTSLHGVIGFYFNENDNRVTGIAEYDSRARLSEIQRSCEADPAYGHIQSRAEQMITSFEEWILDKLNVDQ